MKRGKVTLVGAGPGDPDLLTLRAVRALGECDVLYYDALIDPRLLELTPSGAQRLFVGKRAGRHSLAQATIDRLLVRSAQRGQRVVRLKCGDPFVFGRGGEELAALSAAGIPVEIVPGVSSAIAAPGLAGIPLTHRGVSAGFVVLSGHAPSAYAALANLAQSSLTVVLLMALGRRAAIADFALANGWRATTPVAIIVGASTAQSFVWRGTLATIGAVTLADNEAPGLIVIGDVVDVSSAWNLNTVQFSVETSHVRFA